MWSNVPNCVFTAEVLSFSSDPLTISISGTTFLPLNWVSFDYKMKGENVLIKSVIFYQ